MVNIHSLIWAYAQYLHNNLLVENLAFFSIVNNIEKNIFKVIPWGISFIISIGYVPRNGRVVTQLLPC